jgi:hypothetical protein
VEELVAAMRHENEKTDAINRGQACEDVLRGVKFALAMY